MDIKFTFLFLNLARIQMFIPVPMGEGSTGLGIIPKKKQFLVLALAHNIFFYSYLTKSDKYRTARSAKSQQLLLVQLSCSKLLGAKGKKGAYCAYC